MNQAILFPDHESWDADRQALCFPVQVNGMPLTCAVSGAVLTRRFGEGTPIFWLAQFRASRWDLEDEAEALIADDAFDDQGWLWLP
ncbi:DUF1488 domain-containing protein [Shimwellia pseudoproteus]|uniref:DUF1488 domain-containing protein n=1 Tax=Shimwellia pseudoproteus TaxID=570012 RepID=UPI0018EA4BED|nr:DUF1488 domain-containing protein [Shimwellia pseudoproteus]MBJ3815095.1 DUF1488 domain-containing protein [Shimwellia pseudoproteus]